MKATVDAYDGTVKLYQWDTEDPVLKTWMKAFPDTVQPKSAIKGDLLEHLRYPQDMFKVQRELLTRYHVTNPAQFYSGSDAWQVPDDPTNKDGNAVPPYYLSMKMPGDTAQRFSLTTTFTPNGRPNLGGFMAVDADATSKEYGRLRLLRVTQDVPGPAQVQSKLNGLPSVAQFVRDLKGADSDIQYGNLLTVPLDGGFLYVEPVYAQGRNALYPLLKKVAVSYVDADQPAGDTTKDTTVFEDNLTQALNAVFGVDAPTQPTPEQPNPDQPGTTPRRRRRTTPP